MSDPTALTWIDWLGICFAIMLFSESANPDAVARAVEQRLDNDD